MQCEEIRKRLSEHFFEGSAGSIREEIEEHLKSCESCRAEADGLRDLWSKLGSIPPEKPGLSMQIRFDHMLEEYRQSLDQSLSGMQRPKPRSRLLSWWPSQPLAQLGMTCVGLLIGIVVGLMYRHATPQPSPDITQIRTEIRDLRQMLAISLLQQQSASERLKGVSWSYQLDRPDHEIISALLDTLMHDPNPNVRLAAVDALKKSGDKQIVRRGIVEAMARQDSPLVQIALIEAAVELKEKESVSSLRKLSEDKNLNEAVRKRAQWGLQQLS